MKRLIFFLSLLTSYILFPLPVSAHSFGKLYNLPVPFWMYLYGGVTAIVISFLIIGYFFNKSQMNTDYKKILLTKWRVLRLLVSPSVIFLLQLLSVLLFLVAIISGFIGRDLALVNINMTLFWVIFVLGLTYLTALIGNIYAVFNPFKVITEWVEALGNIKATGFLPYPSFLGYTPALVFYFFFIWFELFGKTTPLSLSLILLSYTNLTFLGIIIFGKKSWLTYGEFFSVFFRLIGKMAPIECIKGELYLRPPFVGLLSSQPRHFSLLLFVLFMLSSTAFDGLKETTWWYKLYREQGVAIFGQDSLQTFGTLGLLLSPFVFLGVYLLLIWVAKVVTKNKASLRELSLQFSYSLVPIALVYNIAHYFTLVITEGSNILALLSDPFGFGWNLFGTAHFRGIPVIDTNIVWHSQVAFILLGHIVGVFLAHLIALRVFSDHKKALLSQFPMLLLMVIYTIAGLWILSQPINPGV